MVFFWTAVETASLVVHDAVNAQLQREPARSVTQA